MIQQEHKIDENVFYIHKIDHRNHSSEKSQWKITENEERVCFKRAYTAKWNALGYNYNYWGLHFNEMGRVDYLGISKFSGPERYDIFIAKFVDGNKNSKWHGYPANHVQNNQDIPPSEVLLKWYEAGHIRKAAISKVLGGKKCTI